MSTADDLAQAVAEFFDDPLAVVEVDADLGEESDAEVGEDPADGQEEGDLPPQDEDAEGETVEIGEEFVCEAPPIVVPSFTERIDALVAAMGDALLDPALHTDPENMTMSMFYDRAQGGRFVGYLYSDAATGADVKMVTPEGRTVWL